MGNLIRWSADHMYNVSRENQPIQISDQDQLSFSQRMNLTPWKNMKILIPLQSIALVAIGFFFEVYFFIFGGVFILISLINYFPFRKHVRFYLIGLSFDRSRE